MGFPAGDTAMINESPIQDITHTPDQELKTHLELTDTHFLFLSNELGFKLTRSRMDGHEHTTIFTRNNLSVHIIFTWGTLPMIYIKNNLLPYDESKGLDNIEIVHEYSDEMRTIMEIHSERLKPAYEYFLKHNYDSKLLQEDFENTGREDYVKYMTLAGTTARDIISGQKGRLKDK